MSQLKMMRGGKVVVAAVVIMVSMAALLLFQCDIMAQGAAKPKPKFYTHLLIWAPKSVYKDMTVKAGDKIVFWYSDTSEEYNNVMEVNVDRYNACNVVGVHVYRTGKYQFTLTKGDHYFICGVGHNMKIKNLRSLPTED